MTDKHSVPVKSKPQPVLSGERIDFVDILRGFALYGVLAMNINALSGQSLSIAQSPDRFDKLVLILVNLLLQAKFYSMFSFLFGWGMSVQMERAAARGARFLPRFSRRLFVLLGIGLVHATLIWVGDILTTYALYGFVLILFRKRSHKVIIPAILLSLGLSIVMTLPGDFMTSIRAGIEDATSFMRIGTQSIEIFSTGTYWQVAEFNLRSTVSDQSYAIYTFGNIFSMFLLGLLVGKRRIFQKIEEHTRLLWIVLATGLVVGGVFNTIFVYAGANPNWVSEEYQRLVVVGSRTIGAPALMLFYVSGIILLLRRKSWKERLMPLGNVGRMALTNYLTQSVVFTLVFYNYGLGLYGETSATFNQILVLIMYLAQIRFSAWWFERYQFGPVEWLWRALTYGKRPPFQIGESYEELKPPLWVVSIQRASAKIPPLVGLAAVWMALFVWAAGLVDWNMRLSARLNPAPFKVVVQVTATPEPEIADGQNLENNVGEDLFASDMQVLEYHPGLIAASGDVWALAATFDIEAAYEQIERLSSPLYLGRQAASPSGWAAGDYLAEQFAALGLQPVGENGTFFQEFPVVYTPLSGVPKLSVTKPDGNSFSGYRLHEDFSPVVRWYSGPGQNGGALAWLDNCTSADFAILNVVDKVVMCNNSSAGLNYSQASRNALEHGAAGLLLLTDPKNRAPDMGATFYDVWVPVPLPTFLVYTNMLTDLLAGSGINASELVENYPPVDLATVVSMQINTAGMEACAVETCLARNVLGALPGRDPAYADEVVIIGAHYDHLGNAPDGLFWPGANDDASGVAILLEIARSWQTQGYLPLRTVIFAAWDAEEIGLIGSRYYTQNPVFPLGKTLAMFQLDMVGAGPGPLQIDGEEALSDQLYRVAEALGVDALNTNIGRSDHTPFNDAGVPAAMLSYFSDPESYRHYHRPADTIDVIEEERLQEAAAVVEIALLDLVESAPLIEKLLAQRSMAAEAGNVTAFLATSSPDQDSVDAFWLDDLNAQPVDTVTMNAYEIKIYGDHASALVKIRVVFGDENGAESVANGVLAASFNRRAGSWLWDGPDLEWAIQGDTTVAFPVAYPPGEANPTGLGESAAHIYAQKAALLGLPGEPDSILKLLPDTESIRLSTALWLPTNQAAWVSEDEIKLVYSPEISTSLGLDLALSKLILAEAGVTEASAPWLWQGLPLVIEARENLKAAHIQYIPKLSGVLDGMDQDRMVAAWAATDYLLWRLGWEDLGAFISDLGQACRKGFCDDNTGIDAALENSLGANAQEFDQLWRRHWRRRLEAVQTGLDTVLMARTQAVEEGDLEVFIATVDSAVPQLAAVQRYWFNDLSAYSLENITLGASPLALLEDGSVLAEVNTGYQFSGGDFQLVTARILFTRGATGYHWAGSPLEILVGDGLQVRYPEGQRELAEALLIDGRDFYTYLAEQLEIEAPEALTISLYDDQDSYRSAIALSFQVTGWSRGWTAPDADIKLLVNSANVESYYSDLANHLARNLMHQTGVGRPPQERTSEWLLKGVSTYLSGPLDKRETQNAAAAALPDLSVAAAEERLPHLGEMLPDDKMTEGHYHFARCQAWDAVRYLVHTYGLRSMKDLIGAFGESTDPFQTEMGQPLGSFQDDWGKSLSVGHILPEWKETADRFDYMQADRHLKALTSRDLKGRQAGSPGARAASEYIAGQFAEYGLVPIGDLDAGGATYFQTFPISDTQLLAGPRLELLDEGGKSWKVFSLRDDFLAVRPVSETVGVISGEMILVHDLEIPEDVDLNGKVVLLKITGVLGDKGTWEPETAWAVEKGAAGLVVVGNKREPEVTQGKHPLLHDYTNLSSIPVFELTMEGYRVFLEAVGREIKEINTLPSGIALDVSILLDFTLTEPVSIETVDALGLLPGADPLLSHELVIVGAHYDHVGDDPDREVCLVSEGGESVCENIPGKAFSGANDNASGIAMMLEIARLWQQAGYRPQRSVLFAAWGGQELGENGSRYFTENPTISIDGLQGMLDLAGVAGGEGFHTGVQGDWQQDGLLLYNISAAGLLFDEKLTIISKYQSSDFLSIDRIGGPSLLLSWRLSNDVNLNDEYAHAAIPERLGIVGRLAALVLMALGR